MYVNRSQIHECRNWEQGRAGSFLGIRTSDFLSSACHKYTVTVHFHPCTSPPPSTEYWMIYRGPGFLAVVWFGSSPTPSPVSKLHRRHTGRLRKRETTCSRERAEEGVGEEPTAGKPGPLKVVQYSLLLNVVMFYTFHKRGRGVAFSLSYIIVALTQRPAPDFLRLQVVGLEPDVL